MLRKLAIAIAASGAMMSAGYVHALGMGDIELESALNQPLNAHIKLIKASELEDWEIKPDLASSLEFQKSGIEHVFFLNNLKFKIERVGEDVFIRLSSKQPVVEPFLNFLVQVDWPNGRLLREYTLLLDPPVFSEEWVEPVTAPAHEKLADEFTGEADSSDATLPGMGVSDADDLSDIPDVVADSDISDLPDVAEQTSEKTVAAPLALKDAAVKEAAAPKTYTVRADDTLWEVALRTRPHRSITPQQAMLAIQDLNPDAFIGGNINRLKKNQVLRLPNEEQVRNRSFKQSVSQVAFQNQALNQRKAQLDATRKSQVIERDTEVAGAELKLLAGGAATAASERGASGKVVAKTAGDQSKLDSDLSLALEDLDKSKRANQELSARLDLLEEQLKTLQRIISLKDEQMVALQVGFAESAEGNKVDPRQAELTQLAAATKSSEPAKSKADLNFASSAEKALPQAGAKPEADKKPEAD
ncbi:MAG: FimV/HubP family polar landmark protein, partial [Bermanella sp.]